MVALKTAKKQRVGSRQKRGVSLVDVAAAAGVSMGVASKVLNSSAGNIRISERVAKRVREAGKSLNYTPNFAAASLTRNRSKTIGLFVRYAPRLVFMEFIARLILGMVEGCSNLDHRLQIVSLAAAYGPEECIKDFRQRRIDGLICILPVEQFHEMDPLAEWNSQTVVVGPGTPGYNFPHFWLDNTAAVQLAMDHLYERGHRRIAFIGDFLHGRAANPDTRHRGRAFAAHARRLGILDPTLVMVRDETGRYAHWHGDPRTSELVGSLAMEHLLSLPARQRPTAVIGYNDMATAAAMQYAQKHGVQCPQDLSFVGIDDSQFATFVTPPMTAVKVPFEEVGLAAATSLIRMVTAGDKLPPQKLVLLPPKLIVRESS